MRALKTPALGFLEGTEEWNGEKESVARADLVRAKDPFWRDPPPPEVCSALLFFSSVQEVLRIGQPEGLVDLALGRLVFFALLVLTVITAFLKPKLL